MILYSLGLIGGYALAKWVTPRCSSIKSKRFHLHHWMWAGALLGVVLAWEVSDPLLIGWLTGISLEGLSYKNWGLLRNQQNA